MNCYFSTKANQKCAKYAPSTIDCSSHMMNETIANLKQFRAKHLWCGCLLLAVKNCCYNAALLANVDTAFYSQMPAVDGNRESHLVNESHSSFPWCISHIPVVLSKFSLKIK